MFVFSSPPSLSHTARCLTRMRIVCILTGNARSLLDLFFRQCFSNDMEALEKSKAGRMYDWASDEGLAEGWVAQARQMALSDQNGIIPALSAMLGKMSANDATWVSYGKKYTYCLN